MRKKVESASANRRGSPEAIAKRRAARAFNDLYSSHERRDGRSEKRRLRLLAELESGKRRSGRELKPLEVLVAVDELLGLGEPLLALKKRVVPTAPLATGPTLARVLGELHAAYGFRPESYAFVGVSDDLLRIAGILPGSRRKSSGA